MSYLVLARKWRPKGFEDLVGQEPITRILGNALAQGRLAHAYLFSGPRGVGKTSTARILAKALNCESGTSISPCDVCASCRSITDGSSVDVMEIDGASNNSVDDVRDLRERVRYAPAGGRYKVYIIDEVHMLSTSAFNALLKTLEEPPSHVVFVLATTASRKIPATVLSRCQHLPFRRVPSQKIKERLKLISAAESITISDSALDMVARAAEGSMRDSLTILDQVSAFSSDVNDSEIKDMLGVADFSALSQIAAAIINGDRGKVLSLIEELVDRGTDLKAFTKDLMQFSRDLLVARVASKPEDILDISDNELKIIRELAGAASEDFLTLLLAEMIKAENEVRAAFSPRVALEMSLIRASFLSTLKPVQEALENIEALMNEQGSPTKTAHHKAERQKQAVKARTEDQLQTQMQKDEDIKALPEKSAEVRPVEVKKESLVQVTEEPALPVEDKGLVFAARPAIASGDFWNLLILNIDELNHPLAGRLSAATGRPVDDKLIITLNGGNAIHAEAIEKSRVMIEKAASEIAGKKLYLKVETEKKTAPGKKELKEKIMSEPIIKEAMDLFEGRVVDVKAIANSENGGDYV